MAHQRGPPILASVQGQASPAADDWRISLTHDYLLVMRGAERTFAAIADLFARAPIFTLLYDVEGTHGRFSQHRVTTSSLQRLGVRQSGFRRLLPLYPGAVQRLKLPECDLVLSSSSAFAHGVHVPSGAVHVCYCHSPFRYAWHEKERALAEVPAPLRPLLRRQLERIRSWDVASSRRVDVYIANSQLTRERVRRFYGRDATVIHPPVETHRFAAAEPSERLLVVSELVRHKRVAVALEAARRARVPIRVVGVGPDQQGLRTAYPEADFRGRVSDGELAEEYARARAVLVPSVEEFGIVAVEAQAAGRPVIAARAGGALETVLDGRTGLLATPDDVDAFTRAIERIGAIGFQPEEAVAHASGFSVGAFQDRISALVASVLDAPSRARAALAGEQ
jgi:glycosyltransferase involved in cell wall biosynthesis